MRRKLGMKMTMEAQTAAATGRPGQIAAFPRTKEERYQSAFLEVYGGYYTKVFAYIYSRTNNVELTKDLTAEVFEKAWVKGHSVREAAAYSTWLFMVAKNVVVGHYRRQQREQRGINRARETASLEENPHDPEETTLHSEAVAQLMRKVTELSTRDQELLALKFEGELSYAEIARVMKLSEVNVRVSMFRALKRLRKLMEAVA
jgi:RNA polymerase sigma factor (sigma-70 family)